MKLYFCPLLKILVCALKPAFVKSNHKCVLLFVNGKIFSFPGPDLQIGAWVGHFMCGETLLHGIGQIKKLCLAQLACSEI